jgi:hypothetical protein
MVLCDPNREAFEAGIFEEYNITKNEIPLIENNSRNQPRDMSEIPARVAAANARREIIDESWGNLMKDPEQLCGGVLEYDNHSSSYLLNSGGLINISLKALIINGSITVSDGTDVVMENVTIYFNFAGTDPYISVIGGSSLTLRNVTVDSDVPVRIYSERSNITMENTFVNKVKGNDVILGNLTMDNSYIAGLEDTFVIDRSLFELREGHINGSSTGVVRFVDSVFYISNSAVSNINGLNARSTSTGEIRDSMFYNNKNAIFSNGQFKISENLTIHNTSFLGNERDIIGFQIDVEVRDCIFANSTEKTIGDSDGRSRGNRGVNRDDPIASFVMNDNIFYNNSFLEFASVNLTTAGNVYYDSREGYDIYDCNVFMKDETFFKEIQQGLQVNDVRDSDAILEELTFTNWYSPISATDSNIDATACVFDYCSKGFDLSMNKPDFDISLTSCTFSNCYIPITIDGSGGVVNIEKLAVIDCSHAVDIYYSDVIMDDALIITSGWNLRTQHALVNAMNMTMDVTKTTIGTDSTLNILLEMELLLLDYEDQPLSGVFIDVEEIGGGPSYLLKSDDNGIVEMMLINITKESSGTIYYDVYRIYHESEQWGYLYEEVNIENGEFLILRIGFSDLAITSFEQSNEEPYHGMDMTTTVWVKNLDLMPTVDLKVYFYMDFDVKEQRYIPALGPNESAEMIFGWKALQGGQMLGIHVDPLNEIFESNETNNYFSEFVQVIAEPEKPMAHLVMSLNKILVGEKVVFNASGSTTGTPEIQYNYYFGDGNNSGWVNYPEVVRTYNQTGLFFPFCKVRDGYDRISSNSSDLILEVMEPPPPPKRPIAHIAPPFYTTEFITVESLITFSPVGSYSPDEAEIINYKWDFGDGEIIESMNNTATPHKYEDDLNYTVSLVVTDSRNLDSLPATVRINVVNLPPKAVAWLKPASVKEGGKVFFSSIGTTDPDDNPDTELIYEWIFPNGTIISGKMISKIFDESGDFDITFRVTDDDNGSDIKNLFFSVIEGENGTVVKNGSGEDKGIFAACWDFIIDYWLWSLCILVVVLFASSIFIRTRFQSKKSRYRKLMVEQKGLEERIREKEVKRSYKEAEKKIKKRILSGERIDFTVSDGEVPSYDDDIEYYGLDNVLEYDGNMGIGVVGVPVDHDDYEEDEYYNVEEYVDHEEENYFQDDEYEDESEDRDDVDFRDYDDEDEEGMETDHLDFQGDDYDEESDPDLETDDVDFQDDNYDDDDDGGMETDHVDYQSDDYIEEDDQGLEPDDVDFQDDYYNEEDDRGMEMEDPEDTGNNENEIEDSDFEVMVNDSANGDDRDSHYEFRVEKGAGVKSERTGIKQNEEDDDWNWTEDQ